MSTNTILNSIVDNTLTVSPLDFGNIYSTGSFSLSTDINNIGLGKLYDVSTAVKIDQSGIRLNDTADLVFGSKSLMKTLERIEERLNLLSINDKLEKEWEELKILGDRYRQLEKEIIDKIKTWDILKEE